MELQVATDRAVDKSSRQFNTLSRGKMGQASNSMMALQRLAHESAPVKRVMALQKKASARFAPIQREARAELDIRQDKAATNAPPTPHSKNSRSSNGLPPKLKSGIENLSGISMGDVTVQRNSSEPAKVGAHAFAQGTHIHLGSGQDKHLPHEAWHVVQQKQGRVRPTIQMKGIAINDDVGLEREADVMGARALQFKSTKYKTNRQIKSSNIAHKDIHQLALKAANNKFKKTAGLEEEEKTFNGFLKGNGIADRFYDEIRVECVTDFEAVLAAHKTHRAGKSGNATTGGALVKLYDALVDKAKANAVMEGTKEWEGFIASAIEAFVPSGSNGKPLKKDYSIAAEAVWPIALGDIPNPFITALKEKLNNHTPFKRKELSKEVTAVLDHADARYKKWRTVKGTNRGAWAGSDDHGKEPKDYAPVSSKVNKALKEELPGSGTGWKYHDNSLSAEKGFSLHKGYFIYHL